MLIKWESSFEQQESIHIWEATRILNPINETLKSGESWQVLHYGRLLADCWKEPWIIWNKHHPDCKVCLANRLEILNAAENIQEISGKGKCSLSVIELANEARF